MFPKITRRFFHLRFSGNEVIPASSSCEDKDCVTLAYMNISDDALPTILTHGQFNGLGTIVGKYALQIHTSTGNI